MKEINENLQRELLAMQAEDYRVREELAATGELFDGYNSTMEAIHLKNAMRLEEMIRENGGWFDENSVGKDGAEAAWIIVQHAISRPDLQRMVLPMIEDAAEKGEIPRSHAAYLHDRILHFEGKPQIYGTQFDWNERSEMSPHEIFEPEKLDERRAAVGLETPYSEIIKAHNAAVKKSNEIAPADFAKREQEFVEWARRVGWRE